MKTPTLRRAAASTLLAAAALLGAGAHAAIVQYDFSTTLDFSSGTPAVGTTFSGSFAYNDAGAGPSYALTAFSFVFNGTTYALGDLASGDVLLDGNTLLGLDATSNDGVIAFVSGTTGTSDASFLFDIPGGATGTGNFTATLVGGNTVPEPAPLVLIAGLLPLLGAVMRRRTRRGAAGSVPAAA